MSKFFLGAFVAFFVMFLATVAFAAETWQNTTMICDDDINSMIKFYNEEELVPIMAGIGRELAEAGKVGQEVVTFIMQDPDGKFAMIRYYGKNACLLGVGGQTIYDAEVMNRMLGLSG